MGTNEITLATNSRSDFIAFQEMTDETIRRIG